MHDFTPQTKQAGMQYEQPTSPTAKKIQIDSTLKHVFQLGISLKVIS
jgi:hypothetical protein